MEATISEFDRSGSQAILKERFYRYFQEACTEMQEQMAQLESYALVGGERKDAVEHVLAGISRLSNEVADLTGTIPGYDQRIYSQAIKALQEKLQETQSKFEPKPRFQFKTLHKNGSAISINDAAELAAQKRWRPGLHSGSNDSSIATTPANMITPPSEADSKDTFNDLPSFPKNYNEEMTKDEGPIRKPSFSEASNVNISGHTGLHIILPSSASHATASGSLTRLNRCVVDMSIPTASGAPFAGLALKNIKMSLIVAGRVAGAAHITAVENSIIVVASRQVRMHECKNVDIYLDCTSRPIIEDCSSVRFAPLPETHKVVDAGSSVNQWDQVDDFKWLKAEHSPNWSVLPESERLKDEIWATVVAGGPGVGLDDILEKFGIIAR